MIFNEIIEKSEVTLISSSKKLGKLTLALKFCAKDKTLIISGYQKPIFIKRLNAIANLLDEDVQSALGNLSYLTLKEDWLELKIKYGFDFIIEDIKRAVTIHEAKNVIFHRLDLMFGTHLSDNISVFMEKLLLIKDKHECKYFITSIPHGDNEETIETIEDFSDVYLQIDKEKERIITVKNSIFPVKPDKYYFLYKDDRIEIKPVETNIKLAKKTHILLITDKRELINLHKYIFDKKDFVIDVATSMTDTINKILSGPDIIIYNPKSEDLDLSVCNTIKQQKIASKLIYITQNDYVRTEDKMKALESGCYEMFPLNFALGEYILEIEKMLNNNFYTGILNILHTNKTITKTESLCDIVDSLYEEKIFFTTLRFKSAITPEEIRKKLRSTDIIYYDADKNEYILTLINIRERNIKPVLSKLFTDEKTDVDINECYRWPEIKREICK